MGVCVCVCVFVGTVGLGENSLASAVGSLSRLRVQHLYTSGGVELGRRRGMDLDASHDL